MVCIALAAGLFIGAGIQLDFINQQRENMNLIIDKGKSQAQERLLKQLLESRWILKHEHDELRALAASSIITSNDASVVIKHMLAMDRV